MYPNQVKYMVKYKALIGFIINIYTGQDKTLQVYPNQINYMVKYKALIGYIINIYTGQDKLSKCTLIK